MRKSQRLQDLIKAPETLVMPDAYDPISARVVEWAGFEAVQCSGYSFAVSMGYAKETDVSFEQNVEKTRQMAEAVDVPVMADGEDGFGDGDALKAVVRYYIEAGAAGVNIEDQNLQGEGPGRIVSEERMLDKIRCVREAAMEAGDDSFVLNARTDALVADDDRRIAQSVAVERANRYLAAGATLCFVMGIRTLEEVKLFAKEVDGPVSVAAGLRYNIHEFSVLDCCEAGVARVSLPTVAVLSSVKALVETMRSARETRRFDDLLAKDAVLTDMTLLTQLLSPKR